MGTLFRVVDLTQTDQDLEVTLLQAGTVGTVDLDHIQAQLHDIRDALSPVLSEQSAEKGMHLNSMELDLTVGLEGQIWFVAKGKAEASLKLIWERT